MAKVALIHCDVYDDTRVYEAVGRGIELIGGLDGIFSHGEKVLLKPNMLQPIRRKNVRRRTLSFSTLLRNI